MALVVPTSGSTGEPKGAMLTAAALRHSARATHDRLGGPGQWLLALPVTHVAGLTVLVRSLEARTRPEVLDLYGGFSVEAFVAATARLHPGVRHYTSLVPTQLRRLLDAGADLSSYDAVLVGGAALSPTLHDAAAAAGRARRDDVRDVGDLRRLRVRRRAAGRCDRAPPGRRPGGARRSGGLRGLPAAARPHGRRAGRRPARDTGPRPVGSGRPARGARPGRRRGRVGWRERAGGDGRAGARRAPGGRGLRRGRAAGPGVGRAGGCRRPAD